MTGTMISVITLGGKRLERRGSGIFKCVCHCGRCRGEASSFGKLSFLPGDCFVAKNASRNDTRLMVGIFELMIGLQKTDQDLIGERMHLMQHVLPGFARKDIRFAKDLHDRFDQHISEK